MNNFVHVESVYLPRSASGSEPTLCSASELLPALDAPHAWDHPMPARTMRPPSAHSAVPPSTERGTGAENFNVGEFLVDRTSPILSPVETRIDEDDTPPHLDAGHQCPSTRISLARQPSPMDEDKESHEDPDVQSGLLVPFNS